jgi:hypothetical protein
MDRLISLDFDVDLEYEETSAGMLVPIRLIHGDRSVELSAWLDTGAADCLFDRFYADILGLAGSGVERDYRTVTGSFKAFGHEVTIETLGLQWPALGVFLHYGKSRPRICRSPRLAGSSPPCIVHYEQRLFLGQYGR